MAADYESPVARFGFDKLAPEAFAEALFAALRERGIEPRPESQTDDSPRSPALEEMANEIEVAVDARRRGNAFSTFGSRFVDAGTARAASVRLEFASDPVSRLQVIGPDDVGSPIDTSLPEGTDFPGFGGTDTTVPDTGGAETRTPDARGTDTTAPDIGDPFAGFAPADVDQARLDWESIVQPQLDAAFTDAWTSATGGGSVGGGDFASQLNGTLAGVVAGAAIGIGGPVGAALGALALMFIPRMLAAFEEELVIWLSDEVG